MIKTVILILLTAVILFYPSFDLHFHCGLHFCLIYPILRYWGNIKKFLLYEATNQWKKYSMIYLTLSLIYFLSYLYAFGCDEGNMENYKFLSEIYSFIFRAFNFPFAYLLPTNLFLTCLCLNILFYTILCMVFLKIIGNKYGTETQYLLSTKANSKRLSESIQQAEKES